MSEIAKLVERLNRRADELYVQCRENNRQLVQTCEPDYMREAAASLTRLETEKEAAAAERDWLKGVSDAQTDANDKARRALEASEAYLTRQTERVEELERLYETARENNRAAWSAIRLIRETIETTGPVGALPSEEAVLKLKGPEIMHEAEILAEAVRALATKVLGSKATLDEIDGCFQAAYAEGFIELRSEIEDLPECAKLLDVLDRRIMFVEALARRARSALDEGRG